MPQPFFCDKHISVIARKWENPMRRSSDSCLAGDCFPAVKISLPSCHQWPAFAKDLPINTYSGGTVRDSHPVILFSIPGSAPGLPRNGLSNCREYCSTLRTAMSRTISFLPGGKSCNLSQHQQKGNQHPNRLQQIFASTQRKKLLQGSPPKVKPRKFPALSR